MTLTLRLTRTDLQSHNFDFSFALLLSTRLIHSELIFGTACHVKSFTVCKYFRKKVCEVRLATLTAWKHRWCTIYMQMCAFLLLFYIVCKMYVTQLLVIFTHGQICIWCKWHHLECWKLYPVTLYSPKNTAFFATTIKIAFVNEKTHLGGNW